MRRLALSLLLFVALCGSGFGQTATVIRPASTPVITTQAIPEAVENKKYSFQLTATRCPKVGCTWSVTGLPKGLTANTKGLISGTPIVSGKFNINVTVK